jgi:hypothetical protein
MDPVGADQHVTGAIRPSGEACDHAIGTLIEADQPVADVDRPCANPLLGSLIEQALQLAAMNRELRPGIACIQDSRLGPDVLAEAVAIDQLLGPDPGRIQAAQQPQLRELFDRMRQKVDANAEFADSLCLLENLDLDALFVQAKRRAEATDAATDHERLHRHLLPSAGPWSGFGVCGRMGDACVRPDRLVRRGRAGVPWGAADKEKQRLSGRIAPPLWA